MPNVRHLIVVLGDQLDRDSAAFDGFDARRDRVWMAEVAHESAKVWSSKPRIAMFLAAMRHFAAELRTALTGATPVPGPSRSPWWVVAVVVGVAVALIAAAIVVLPRLSLGHGSATPPNQTQTAAPSPTIAVPNLIGLTQAEAIVAIENAKLSLGAVSQVMSPSVPKGVVAAMSPVPGSAVPSGSAVDITVSIGPA